MFQNEHLIKIILSLKNVNFYKLSPTLEHMLRLFKQYSIRKYLLIS